MRDNVRIGCAGWSLPSRHAEYFPIEGSHLQRYAERFLAVEINSSFYRPHRPATYARWAASVPDAFRFAVKVPKEITHTRKLADPAEPLARLLSECANLGEKLGPLLVQLPPSLAYDTAVAPAFFAHLRERFAGAVVCEPRHPTWFTEDAEHMLVSFHVARVAADPARVPAAAEPGGWPATVYYRLHGSPRIYYSAYEAEYLDRLALILAAAAHTADVWCIFDNTALDAATADALGTLARLGIPGPSFTSPGPPDPR